MNIQDIESEFQSLDAEIEALRARKAALLVTIREAGEAEHAARVAAITPENPAARIIFGKE